MLNLTWWNEKTYEDVKNFFKTSNRCSITNATGTGKTSVIAKTIHDYYDSEGSVLVVTPRNNISDQYQNPFYELNNMSLNFVTYSKISKDFSTNEIVGNEIYNHLKLIVVDEAHRSGAKTYMPAIECIINLNPGIKVLGATATPRRTDQKYKTDDMVDILFDGNRAGEFDIVTCLKEKILPYPIYVNTLYDKAFDKLENNMMSRINNIKDEEEKRKALNTIKECRINWEESFGYDKIFRTFLSFPDLKENNKKILIFCKGKQHINEMRNVLDDHFKDIYKDADNLIIDEYHTGTTEKPFKDFRDNNDPGTVQILYSIDKFEEGIHIDNLNAIIMIRDTESQIKYFQQIGRVLSLSGVKNPIIIDLVSNAEKINGGNLFIDAGMEIENDLLSAFSNIRNENGDGRNRHRDIPVKMYDTVSDAIKTFENIQNKIIEQSLYEYNGEKGTYVYFAEKYHKDKTEIYNKLNFQDNTIKEAIETSLDVIDYDVIYNGETVPINILCKRHGISDLYLVDYRYKHGKTIEEVINGLSKIKH